MKIWVDTAALTAENKNLLAANALSALKYLFLHSHELSFELSDLGDRQIELLENEEIRPGNFKQNEAEGTIRLRDQLEFIRNNEILERADGWTELSRRILFPSRKAVLRRETRETAIQVELNLDGKGESKISTGLKFFDHMLEQIARHGLVDLDIHCEGDLEVDEHHTVEDTAITLGQALRKAISKNKAGIQRYGFVLPMDEAEATVSIDLSDRPYLNWNVKLKREYIGDLPTEMVEHFFYSLAMNAGATLHVTASGKNEHHIIESVFKGFAKALRFAVSRNERIRGILPTTKGKI